MMTRDCNAKSSSTANAHLERAEDAVALARGTTGGISTIFKFQDYPAMRSASREESLMESDDVETKLKACRRGGR